MTLEIDEALADKVRAAATAVGVTVESFLLNALEQHLNVVFDWSDDTDPAIDQQIADEMIQRGDGIPWETFRERLKSFGRRSA